MLYNNGYLIKGLDDSQQTSPLNEYRGIEKFISWPLDYEQDNISKELQQEAFDKWFSYQNVLEVVPEKEFLLKYVCHCQRLKIKTTILKVQTFNDFPTAKTELKVKEILGFDCIVGTQLSYLNLDPLYFKDKFPGLFSRLNSNRLFSTIQDAEQFISQYNKLVDSGENLENCGLPVVALLSTVVL